MSSHGLTGNYIGSNVKASDPPRCIRDEGNNPPTSMLIGFERRGMLKRVIRVVLLEIPP